MFTVTADLAPTALPGFRRVFAPGRLTLGLLFPFEAFPGDRPTMVRQEQLARRAEALGFAALWARDVPLRVPEFGDVGQVYDPWVWLGWIAAQTSRIALGTAAIVLPVRHPLHAAKAAASLDRLSGGRFLLGVASGDRPAEFPAFGVDHGERAARFREHLAVMRRVLEAEFPVVDSPTGFMAGSDLVPKPLARGLPTLVTGGSGQSLEWIARSANGWLTYPRPLARQRAVYADWHHAVELAEPGAFRPAGQSLYIDLAAAPDHPPQPIHLGWRLGRDHLVELLSTLEVAGASHVILNLKYGRRPADEVLEELGHWVVPRFPPREAERPAASVA